jgi:gamma-glutamyl-gamma-aminobutyrate hydrolase PuuD
MKRLLISQKTYLDINGQEIDCLEKTYVDYFMKKGFLLTPLPNNTYLVTEHMKNTDCLVLSGGREDIKEINRRNLSEALALKEAIAREIPVLGICRGMQTINDYFGGSLSKTPEKHKEGFLHEIMITEGPILVQRNSGLVSSYHNDCIMSSDIASGLKIFALSDDGVIEGFYHPKKKIIAVQWHPERYDSKWVDDGIIKYISTTDF